MEIEKALAELCHFGEAAGDRDLGNGIALRDISACRREIAHVDQCDIRQVRATALIAASDVEPVDPAIAMSPAARATSIPRWIVSIQAAQENGTTMPVVPRIERPPTIPSRRVERSLGDLLAAGDRDLDDTSPYVPWATSARPRAWRIMARGIGLMAGSPGGTGRPGLVTVPTPGPARNVMPEPEAPADTSRLDQGAMRDIRIVARVLDNAGSRGRIRTVEGRDRKRGSSPVGQDDLDHRRALAGDKQLVGRARCSRSAGAGRPAAPQGSRRRVGHRCIVFTQNRFPFNTAEI